MNSTPRWFKVTHPAPAVPPPEVLHGGLPQHGQKGGVDWEVETENQYIL